MGRSKKPLFRSSIHRVQRIRVRDTHKEKSHIFQQVSPKKSPKKGILARSKGHFGAFMARQQQKSSGLPQFSLPMSDLEQATSCLLFHKHIYTPHASEHTTDNANSNIFP